MMDEKRPMMLMGRPVVEVEKMIEGHHDIVLGPPTRAWARRVLNAMRDWRLRIEAYRRRN